MALKKLKNIKIELEVSPELALMLGMFIHKTGLGSMDAYASLTDKGRKEIIKIGQKIVDQVMEKADFGAVKNKKKS